MGASLGTGGLKPFPKSCPLMTQAAAKWKKGFLEAARGASCGGGVMSQPDPPGSRRSFSCFCKTQGARSLEHGKGFVAGLSPGGPVPPPHLPAWSTSCLPVSFGDGNPRGDQQWQRGGPWWQRDPSVQGLRLSPAQAWAHGEASARASEGSPEHVGSAGLGGISRPLRCDKGGVGVQPGQVALSPSLQ